MIDATDPAFPVPFAHDPQRNKFVDAISAFVPTGLTKRELFAAMAMEGILAGKAGNESLWADESPEMTAAQAVARADALLAELDKPTPPST